MMGESVEDFVTVEAADRTNFWDVVVWTADGTPTVLSSHRRLAEADDQAIVLRAALGTWDGFRSGEVQAEPVVRCTHCGRFPGLHGHEPVGDPIDPQWDGDGDVCTDCFEELQGEDTWAVTLDGIFADAGSIVVFTATDDETGDQLLVAIDHRPAQHLVLEVECGPVGVEVEPWQVRRRAES